MLNLRQRAGPVLRRGLRSFGASTGEKNAITDVSDEVRHGLVHGRPVVALESTIITHGMPFPANLECALAVQDIVRTQGAVPATIAVIQGRIKVGLSDSELAFLADTAANPAVKTSRRDFPYVLGHRLNGGTTVAGTILIARQHDIPVFVTGGIGGVHRSGESTLDISADLIEMSRTNITVVSSGVKSILDIPRTLEYLETHGILVTTYGDTTDFPAFYTRISGSQSPYQITTPTEAANLISASRALHLQSAILIAVPVPTSDALDPKLIEQVIQEALDTAHQQKITGKAITPFLLSHIAAITQGRALTTNIALIQNNAKIGAQIAVAYANQQSQNTLHLHPSQRNIEAPVIIGGAVVDCCAKIRDPQIKMDGSTHRASKHICGGGVGRNISEAMAKLGVAPIFISAVGDDPNGDYLATLMPKNTFKCVARLKRVPTAQYTAVMDADGECRMGIGDMDIHERITPEIVRSHETIIKESPLLVLDANLTPATLHAAMEIAVTHNVPVFYEPTDMRHAAKLFTTPLWKHLSFMTPNMAELRAIAAAVDCLPANLPEGLELSDALAICRCLVEYVDMVVVTLGPVGVLVVRRGEPDDVFFAENALVASDASKEIRGRLYPTREVHHFANVNGAGDCWTSGFITAMLAGLSEERCVSVGFAAADKALFSTSPVPKSFFSEKHPCWHKIAKYRYL